MNRKALYFLQKIDANFTNRLRVNITSLRTIVTRVVTVVLTLVILVNLAGCTRPFIDESRFTGETLPPAIDIMSREEIEARGITADDVLAVYDQLALIAVRYFWKGTKAHIGDEFYKITAAFSDISPKRQYDTQWDSQDEIVCPYYAIMENFGGAQAWQPEHESFNEEIYPITFSIDIGYEGNIFEHREFTDFGITKEEFIKIADAFSGPEFTITHDYLVQEHGKASSLVWDDVGKLAYPAFIIDRETISNITDQQLLWDLYEAAYNSLYRINFREHYRTYNDLTVDP